VAYEFKILRGHVPETVYNALLKAFHHSRFDVRQIDFQPHGRHYAGRITLREIRLREAKDYCGNHPGPCLLGRPHRKYRYLEGLDWVEFNDLVNDTLDHLQIAANVASTAVVVRIGSQRRIRYTHHALNAFHHDWIKQGESADFADYRGRVAPASEYPPGTPGEYHRRDGEVSLWTRFVQPPNRHETDRVY
jgi:hypothetical protein